jgi:hypothetical protein
MVLGVIADLMAFVVNAAHQVGGEARPVPGNKEGRVDVMLCQDVQDTRGWF